MSVKPATVLALSDPASECPKPVASHPLSRLVLSQWFPVRLARAAGIVSAILFGLYGLIHPFWWLLRPSIFKKDFVAIYVLVRAMAEGTSPSVPVNVLAERYIGTLPFMVFPHPTPHPPTMGMLLLPLALLDFPSAAVAWFFLTVGCLVVAVRLLGSTTRLNVSWWQSLAIAVALLAWPPIQNELSYGNVSILILALVCGMWRSSQLRRYVLAGFLLGITILLKQITWPLVLLLLYRRDWKTLSASLSTILLGYLVTFWLIGYEALLYYIGSSLPIAARVYHDISWNLSVWTLGPRIASGTTGYTPDGAVSIMTAPLMRSDIVASLLSLGVAGLTFLIACLAISKQRHADWSLGVAICLMIVINPVVWGYYLVFALIPIALVLRWLFDQGFPRRETNLALVVGGMLLQSYGMWWFLAFSASGETPSIHGDGPVLPFFPALFLLGPTFAACALGWLTAYLGSRNRGGSETVLTRYQVEALATATPCISRAERIR